MKKSLLLSLVGAGVVAAGAYAAIERQSVAKAIRMIPENAMESAETADMTAEAAITKVVAPTRGSKPKNMEELCSRSYVFSYTSSRTGYNYLAGHGIYISQVGTSDTVHLSWMYYDEGVYAIPDFENGTLRIPVQDVHSWYDDSGAVTATSCFVGLTTAWKSDWEGNGVTFTMNDDGTFSTTQRWGLMKKGTESNGYTWVLPENTAWCTANGSMTYKKNGGEALTCPIYAVQTKNCVEVLNFYDNGNRATFLLGTVDGQMKASVPRQMQIQNSVAPYYLVGNVKNQNGSIYWNWTFDATKATANEIDLGPWTLVGYNASNQLIWWGLYDYAELHFDNALNYNVTSYSGGMGSESDPYRISSVADLNEFIESANASPCTGLTYIQTKDIDLADTPMILPLVNNTFQGVYNGGNFALKGLNLTSGSATTDTYKGIFNTIGTEGAVKNLTLEGKATLSKQYNGVLAGYLFGTLDNVTSRVTIENTASYAGGLVGRADKGSVLNKCVYDGEFTINNTNVGGLVALSYFATFSDCGFTGKFLPGTATKAYVGGIVSNAYPSTFIDCYSRGTFTNDSSDTYRGGIVATVATTAAAANAGDYLFKRCVNYSDIKCLKNMGGIIGYMNMSVANTASNYKYRSHVVIDSCINYGNMRTTGPSSNAGGITGSINHSTLISNCENHGTFTSYQAMYVGGISGYYFNNPTDSTRARITKCRNYGPMKMNHGNTTNYYIGGITGATAAYTTIDSCENYADLESWQEVGGILGYGTGVGHEVIGCVNYGNITVWHKDAAGIVAYCGQTSSEYRGCANYGNVTTMSTLPGVGASVSAGFSGYGIGGILGRGRGHIYDCVNAGVITGASQVGGIAGSTLLGTASNYGIDIKRCLNTGKVVGRYTDENDKLVTSLDTVGAIFGVSTTNSKLWAPNYSSLDSNYYTENVLAEYGEITEKYQMVHPASEIAGAILVNNTAILGAGWQSYDKYCWPSPKEAMWSDMTKVWAAQVVTKHDDVLPNITGNFFVGRPEGLKWTSTVPSLNIHGWDAIWGNEGYTGKMSLTATCGTFSKTLELMVNKTTSVDGLDTSREVAEEVWVGTDGVKTIRPVVKDGKIYIVIRKYTDGTSETVKVLN